MANKKGNYSKVSTVKKYKRYAGTSKEQVVTSHPRTSGFGYNREELIKMHLSRPIIDRAIDERIPANYISEHKWVMSNGNAGDLEGVDDRITSTKDLTPELKIAVLNGILKRLGVKADLIIAQPVQPTEKPKPKASVEAPVKKAVPFALLPSKDQAKIKEEVKDKAIKKLKEENPKSLKSSDLDAMLEGLESI